MHHWSFSCELCTNIGPNFNIIYEVHVMYIDPEWLPCNLWIHPRGIHLITGHIFVFIKFYYTHLLSVCKNNCYLHCIWCEFCHFLKHIALKWAHHVTSREVVCAHHNHTATIFSSALADSQLLATLPYYLGEVTCTCTMSIFTF